MRLPPVRGTSAAQTQGHQCSTDSEAPAQHCGRDGAKRKSVRKSCRSAGDSALSALEGAPAAASGSSCELANPAQVRQIASQTGVLFSAG